jgi:hypothetical protein
MAVYNPFNTIGLHPAIIARCAATKATPDVSNTTVLTNGNINASRVSSKRMPSGGQTPPTVIAGDKLPWKNAQKNGKNNIASEAKNSNIPYPKPICTFFVWYPSNVASRTNSRPQAQIVIKIRTKNVKIRESITESGNSVFGNAPVTEKNGSIIPAPTAKNFDKFDTF